MEFSNERHAAIVDIVSKNHFVTVKDLAKTLGVSEMTIRRDVVVLSENNLVKQVYGGITPTRENSNGKYSLSEEEKKNYDKKRKIAEKALSLLSPNDIIYLDRGTTIQTLSGMIPDTPLTVITNSFASLEAVTKLTECHVIAIGGEFSHKPRVFYNQEISSFFTQYRANKCFIGATGVSVKMGVTCSYPNDVPVKKSMMKSSLEKILLVDSTKFGAVSTCAFASVEDFDVIITEDGIKKEDKEELESLGILVIVV